MLSIITRRGKSGSAGRRPQPVSREEDRAGARWAVAEKMFALMTEDYLAERAKRGSRAKYEAVLAKVWKGKKA